MPSYVKFETPEELVPKILDLLSNANEGGKIRKGVNETTKSIERKLAKLVVIAEDVTPEEIVVHIPMLCQERGVPFVYVKAKVDLGKSIGLKVGTTSVAVENAGSAAEALQDVLKRIPSAEKEEKKEEKVEKKEEKPKAKEKPKEKKSSKKSSKKK